jgi:hypothetical protein
MVITLPAERWVYVGMRKILALALAVILLLGGTILLALQTWSLLDSVTTKLRTQGSAGVFMANVLVHPITVLVVVLVGLVFAWRAFKEYRAHNQAIKEKAESDRLRQIADSLLSGRAGSLVNVNNAPVINQSPTVNQSASLTQSANQSVGATPKIELEPIRYRLEPVWLSDWHEIREMPTEGRIKIKAAVLEIRRNPDDPLVSWIDVRARIELKSPNAEPVLINEGRWIGLNVAHASFAIHGTRRLAIALLPTTPGEAGKNEKSSALTYEGKYEKTGHFDVWVFRADFEPLAEPFYDVDVYLFGTTTLYRPERHHVIVDEVMHFELLVPEQIFRLKR